MQRVKIKRNPEGLANAQGNERKSKAQQQGKAAEAERTAMREMASEASDKGQGVLREHTSARTRNKSRTGLAGTISEVLDLLMAAQQD